MRDLWNLVYQQGWCGAISWPSHPLKELLVIALFVIGLAAAAVGPALTILMDRITTNSAEPGTGSAGMFVAVNDNAASAARRAA